jgi:ribosomal protein L7Ae-like RNA K-turn-binding protein
MPKRKKAAATLDSLGGEAARVVHFLRTDAKAALPSAASNTKLKEAFASELDPQWSIATASTTNGMLRGLGSHYAKMEASASASSTGTSAVSSSSIGASSKRHGLCLGRGAVARAVRRRELSAVVLAKEAGPPLLYAHLAPLAQETGTPICLLNCSSAQLGQPFGLLRASAVGLRADSFGAEHELVELLRRSESSKGVSASSEAPTGAAESTRTREPVPWLKGPVRTALLSRGRGEVPHDKGDSS